MCIPQKEHCFDINGEPVVGETRVVTLVVLADVMCLGNIKDCVLRLVMNSLIHRPRISTALYSSDWLTLPALMKARAYGNCGLCGT
jgi:hypothetical protein